MYQSNHNVDESEIAKFSAIAKEWWNPFSSCRPLHDINPLRVGFINQYTSLAGKQILDVGCGGGILAESLAKLGGEVTGIDLAADSISVAQSHASDQGLAIHYQIASAEEFVEEHAGQFDVVTCMELLEHVPSPHSIVLACSRLLKPDGQFFLSTLNRNLKSYVQAIIGAEYLLKLLPKGTHHYEKFIKPIELFEMLQSAGLSLVNMTGLTYHPIFKAYRLCSDVSVNYLVHARKSI